VRSALQSFTVRAYRVTSERLINKTIAQIEALPADQRFFISRVRRAGTIIPTGPGTVIEKDDVIAVMTHTEALMARGTTIGPEVNDKALLDFPAEVLDVVITNKTMVGKTLREMAALDTSRGAFLRRLDAAWSSSASSSPCSRTRWRSSSAATC
jgi:putative transport protein